MLGPVHNPDEIHWSRHWLLTGPAAITAVAVADMCTSEVRACQVSSMECEAVPATADLYKLMTSTMTSKTHRQDKNDSS